MALLALAATSAGAVVYTIKELPSLPGATGGRGARAINNNGEIAGIMSDAGKCDRAVVWDCKGAIRELAVLPGDAVAWAMDINNAGQAVGWSAGVGNRHKHAVLWEADGSIKDLGTLGGDISEASAINSRGWVVGHSTRKQGRYHAFLWKPDTGMTDLGSLSRFESMATAIDDLGRVAGCSYDSDGYLHAVIWELDGTVTDLGKRADLPQSSAYAINNRGQIAGKSGHEWGSGTAFLWDPKVGLTDIGMLTDIPRSIAFSNPPSVASSAPAGMNDSAEVVGWSTGAHTESRAFYWSAKAGIVNLGYLELPEQPKPGTVLGTKVIRSAVLESWAAGSNWSQAFDINNAGTIVGSSNNRAVIWTNLSR